MARQTMPFGKHKYMLIEDVPTDYLQWVMDNCDLDCWGGLEGAIEEELEFRETGRRSPSPEPERARFSRTTSTYAKPASTPNGNGDAMEVYRQAAAEAVQTWYRELAKKYHPDRGGDTKVMQAINDAHERLKELLGFDAEDT